jgi:uncharacterized phiE125 gp8 family phage protein
MHAILLEPPATEPITTAEVKSFLRIEHEAEDALIGALITAARMRLEAEMRRVMLHQSWRVVLDSWPQKSRITLPYGPLHAITAARLFNAGGSSTTLSLTHLSIDREQERATLKVHGQPQSPGREREGIEIDVTLGFAPSASACPAPLKQAVMMLAAFWFENRVIEGDAFLPSHVAGLIAPYREVRL